jgi:hypothetical protein
MQTQQIETHTRILSQDLEALRKIQGSKSIAETLHEIICNHEPTRGLTLIELREDDFLKLTKIKEECGFLNLGYAIHQILQSQQTTEVITVQKIMKDSCPVVLCANPMAGKSYWIKNTLIPSLTDYPVLVVDSVNEYSFLKEIKSIRELSIENKEHARFVPAQHFSIMGTMQVKGLFTELNMMIDINPQALKELVLIVEEAQSYRSSWFNGFLYKSRHFFSGEGGKGKMIVITPQRDCFSLETFTVFR